MKCIQSLMPTHLNGPLSTKLPVFPLNYVTAEVESNDTTNGNIVSRSLKPINAWNTIGMERYQCQTSTSKIIEAISCIE